MTRNVRLHYFSFYYHASNSLMQCTSCELIDENISQRLNREDMYYMLFLKFYAVFLGENVRFMLYVKCEGARYSDVNEVMHIGRRRALKVCGCLKWWMLLYEMHSIGN